MERGELLAKDVLPLVGKEFRKAANDSGALDEKLKSVRVTQGQFFKELETSRRTIFDEKFNKALAELFSSLSEGLKDSTAGLKGLGRVYAGFFRLVKGASEVLVPILDSVFFVMGEVSDILSAVFSSTEGKIIGGIIAMTYAAKNLDLVFKSIAARLFVVFAILDEIFSLFVKGRQGVLELALDQDLGFEPKTAEEKKNTPDLFSFGNLATLAVSPFTGFSNLVPLISNMLGQNSHLQALLMK